MKRRFSTRHASAWAALMAVGAASAGASCSAADPKLPVDPNPVLVTSAQPAAISGGTLVLTPGNVAIAADSERDVVYVVDLASSAVRTVALQPGDEPGRGALDAKGLVHIALRRAGAIVTIDPASAAIVARTPVCSAPRGVAYEGTADVIHVACAGGELVSLPAAGGAPVRSIRIADRDLRDVIVQPDGSLYVTRFRSAEVLVLDATGAVTSRTPAPNLDDGNSFTGSVAWRAIAAPGPEPGIIMVHQLAANGTVVISQPGGYGSGGGADCGGTIVQTAVSSVIGGQPAAPSATALIGASVAIDLATDDVGNVAIASAGADALFVTSTQVVLPPNPCTNPAGIALPGQPVAVAHGALGYVVQIREATPGSGQQGPLLALSDGTSVTRTIPLPGVTMANTGHYLFHHNASSTSALACASCHPEGHDDGHTWVFDTEGARRTPHVSGSILETAPLHWDGDMSDLTDIMSEVFERRMGGDPAHAGPRHVAVFADWLAAIPAYPASPSGTAEQISHGESLFASSGCGTCHSGAHFTNNQTMNVGTNGAFQVPPLTGVAGRAPYMHDGCAATLADRFDPAQAACNGGESHGTTAQLSGSDVADLISYLETL